MRLRWVAKWGKAAGGDRYRSPPSSNQTQLATLLVFNALRHPQTSSSNTLPTREHFYLLRVTLSSSACVVGHRTPIPTTDQLRPDTLPFRPTASSYDDHQLSVLDSPGLPGLVHRYKAHPVIRMQLMHTPEDRWPKA